MSSTRIFPNPTHTVVLSVAAEQSLMSKAETEQTIVDQFWGLDKQLKDTEEERDKMMEEEKRSIALDNYLKKIQIVAIWEENDRQARLAEAYEASLEEEYTRKMYLEEFNAFANSLDVVRYEWPTKPHVHPVHKERDEESSADNQNFLIKESFANKSTVHVDGIQQAKVLAENLAAAMTLQKSPPKKNLMDDEDEGDSPTTKIPLQSLHSRASSPVLQTALEGQSGIFDRPITPLTRMVDAQTASDDAAREQAGSRGASRHGRPETGSPTNITTSLTSAQTRPRSPHGAKRGDGLFKHPHLKQLGDAYAAEEALLSKIESGSYIPALHGHKQHKWEQQSMLKLIFEAVVQEHQHANLSKTHGAGAQHKKPDVITYASLLKSIAAAVVANKIVSTSQPRTAVTATAGGKGRTGKVKALRTMSASDMSNGRVQPDMPAEAVKVNILELFKFTLFGTWIKRKDFQLFELLFDVTPGHGGRALTLRDWLLVAKAAAHEDHVPSNRIRMPKEHKQVCCTEHRMELAELERKARASDPVYTPDDGVSKKLYAAGARSYSIDKISRDSGMQYRAAAVGDSVWAQYGGGVSWLPGIIANKYDEDQSFEIYYTLSEKEQLELQMQISSKIVIEGYYQHSDQVLERNNSQLKQSMNLSIPGMEEVEEPVESQPQPQSQSSQGSRRSSSCKPTKPLTRPSTEVDDGAFFKYVFSQLTANIPSHSGSFDTEALLENFVSPQFSQLIGGSKLLSLLIDGHTLSTGEKGETEEEKEETRKKANETSLIGILAEQPSTSETEFVELCICLSDVVAYQN